MRNLKLLGAEIVKIMGDLKAYWFNYLFGNLNVFFFFLEYFMRFKKVMELQ